MKFRLTYEGQLRPTQRDPKGDQRNPLASHKHAVRREFHKQLKCLWETDQFLSQYKVDPRVLSNKLRPAADSRYGVWHPGEKQLLHLVEAVAERHHMYGYRFVPLVPDYFHLLCSIHVLFLRHDIPGSVIQVGDIDNRIKTLIDALRLPQSKNQLVGEDEQLRDGEDPFFCLLQDDKQISGFSVETGTLFDPQDKPEDRGNVKIVVTVELRPYYVTLFNLSFV